MTTATVADPEEPKFDTVEVDKRVQRLLHRPRASISVTLLDIHILFILLDVRRMQRELPGQISTLAHFPLETDDDRTFLRERAAGFGRLAKKWGSVADTWRSEVVTHPAIRARVTRWLESVIVRQLDEIACVYEDTAETFALAASDSFAQLAEKELAAIRPGHEQQAKS